MQEESDEEDFDEDDVDSVPHETVGLLKQPGKNSGEISQSTELPFSTHQSDLPQVLGA